MAEEEEKKVKKQLWTVEELEILYAYSEKLEPDEKPNYAEVTELLAADGYVRTEKQVQKKFERMRYEAKYNGISFLRRIEELIEGLKPVSDGEGGTLSKSAPMTPKVRWTLHEMKVLLQCLIEGEDSPAYLHSLLPEKPIEKIRSKLTNVKKEARNQGTTALEVARRQITRLEGLEKQEASEEVESEEPSEQQPVRKGTKRKLDESSDDRSAKKQRVMESPRLTGAKSYDGESGQLNEGELKKVLDQIANNTRINFANMRTFIRDMFDEVKKDIDELKSQVAVLKEDQDIIKQELRALRANGSTGTSTNKTPTPSKTPSSRANGDSSTRQNEVRQQISYYNFL